MKVKVEGLNTMPNICKRCWSCDSLACVADYDYKKGVTTETWFCIADEFAANFNDDKKPCPGFEYAPGSDWAETLH